MNVLENVPYTDAGMGRRKLVDKPHLLLMQAALKPGQDVPLHKANSHVHLLVLVGDLTIELDGQKQSMPQGTLFPVAFGTPMHIQNEGDRNASFLIIKTPNPSGMKT